MKFLMTSRAVPGAPPPTPTQMAELGQFTAEMVKSGVVVLTSAPATRNLSGRGGGLDTAIGFVVFNY